MISAVIAALLLTGAAQDQTAPDPQPTVYEDDYSNGQDASGGPVEADAYAEPEPVVEEAPVQEASPDEPEEEVPMVCRRVHYQDDYGRQRSRRSCTPR